MQMPNKLRFLSKLSSEGNFGEVLLCENTFLSGRKEAVKVIPFKGESEKEVLRELNNNLFESSVLEYLRKSQYIVDIHDAEFIGSSFAIRMEYLEKGSVQGILNSSNFLNLKQVIKISECVLHALEHAHNKKILHLDIKPGNILIKNENVYKLSDFGLSNIKDKDGFSEFKKIYTAHYPPEKLSGIEKGANEQSDIYMLGVTLYRLLNGDSHFSGQLDDLKGKNILKHSIISGKFPNRKKYLPHVPSKFKRIINKCLSTDLDKRYKNAREVRNDFGKLKITYDWIAKQISDDFYRWECYENRNVFLELTVVKNSGYWEMSLKKYTAKNKLNVKKHCYKKLKKEDMYKKLSLIFNEYL